MKLILFPLVSIALATTGGIILGKSTTTSLFKSDKNIAFVALLIEHAYFAPTYFAILSSNSVTTSSCNKLENSDVSMVCLFM